MKPTLTVIVPVYNDNANLAVCYAALSRSTRPPDQVIVIDDGSSEPLPEPPETLPVLQLRLPDGPQGSFVARNRGVSRARGEILVFVDADVRVHKDALDRLVTYLCDHPSVAAVFGSYDDAPAAPHWVSRYKNLMHHYVHQHAKREAASFWTGLGAIRRSAFDAVGGFSTNARTVRDIDMGIRLAHAGHRVHVAPEIQGTHLKRWSFRKMIRSDILDRAIPWTRLIAHAGSLPDDLNLAVSSRWSAAFAWAGLVSLAAVPLWGPAVIACLLCLGAVALLNRALWRFMAAHGGGLFAVGAFCLYTLYLLYSSATFVVVFPLERAKTLGDRSAPKQGGIWP